MRRAILIFLSATLVTFLPSLEGPATSVALGAPKTSSPVVEKFVDPSSSCAVAQICIDGFGTNLAVNEAGTIAVLGEPYWQASNLNDAHFGTAWIFENLDGSWVQVAQLQADLNPGFGSAVAISADGSTVAVTSGWSDVGNYSRCSSEEVEVYTEPAGGWSGTVTAATSLTSGSASYVYQPRYCMYSLGDVGTVEWPPQGTSQLDFYPPLEWVSVSGDGSTIVSSINGDWLYSRPTGGWGASTTTAPSIELQPPADPNVGDLGAGNAPVAISSDGSEVAVSTVMNTPTLTGAAVSLYDRTGATWVGAASQLSPTSVIVNPTPSDDPLSLYNSTTHWSAFGLYTLAFSADGSTLAISDMTKCRVAPTYPMCDNAIGNLATNTWNGYGPGPNYGAGGADVFRKSGSTWALTSIIHEAA